MIGDYMNNSKFSKAISDALTEEYVFSIPEYEDHVFSKAFEEKMHKLIKRRSKPYYQIINTAAKRVACIAVVVIIASMTTILSVKALREAFFGFFVDVFEKFSVVQSAESDSSPVRIDDIYEITCDMSGYDIDFKDDSDYNLQTIYKNNDKIIIFKQSVKSAYDMNMNTEEAKIENIAVNEYTGVYYTDNHAYATIIWDNGDYIISVGSNISKNELIKIAESVKKVE